MTKLLAVSHALAAKKAGQFDDFKHEYADTEYIRSHYAAPDSTQMATKAIINLLNKR